MRVLFLTALCACAASPELEPPVATVDVVAAPAEPPKMAKAMAYFEAKGIDPSVEPEALLAVSGVSEWQHYSDMQSEGVVTLPCTIDILAVLFYSHVTVSFTDPAGKKHTYEGDAGGVGAGEISGVGVIYYPDLGSMLATKAFGVTFIAEEGGTAMVTWGTHGNANIVGIGDGLGAFGGSGSWK